MRKDQLPGTAAGSETVSGPDFRVRLMRTALEPSSTSRRAEPLPMVLLSTTSADLSEVCQENWWVAVVAFWNDSAMWASAPLKLEDTNETAAGAASGWVAGAGTGMPAAERPEGRDGPTR